MTSELRRADQVVAAHLFQIPALDPVREQSPAAFQLIALCSFMAADDVPRRMLYDAPTSSFPRCGVRSLTQEFSRMVSRSLSQVDLLSVNGDGLALHREVQASVRSGLSNEERDSWAEAAGRIVLASFPARPGDNRNWPWAARRSPDVIATTDHLDELGVEPLLAVRLRERAARYLIPQGQLTVAKSLLERALEAVAEIQPEGSLHASVLNDYAVAERAEGRLSQQRQARCRAGARNTPEGSSAARERNCVGCGGPRAS